MTALDRYQPEPFVKLTHPEWSKNAAIYQINTRHITDEGTLAAAERHLPRIRDLGATIVWLMPVHEIGVENRKGELGSPYAVKDYRSVSAELGGPEQLKHFVEAAHDLGLKVILDWVANHTAWDCNLVTEHPEWYARDWKGDFRPTPWWDWDDIIDLDYDHPELREYMTESLAHFVRDFDVDGFRCDVAGYVPLDFWETARSVLEEIKPVFMLAEWETRDLHARAFDMSYAWSWNETLHQIAMGRRDAEALHVYYSWNERSWPKDAMRMTFVSNHDKNAWEGTEFEQFGDCLEAAIVLSVVGEGMPLIYNGQEAGNERRLQFFQRDPIVWREHPLGELYRTLFALKREHSALWNARWGATMLEVVNDAPKQVLSFVRQDDGDKVFAAFNLSPDARTVAFSSGLQHGSYADAFSGEPVTLGDSLDLPAWGYRVLVGQPG